MPDADEDNSDAAEPKSTTQGENKVVICHHTGSWKNPFHPIRVNEHSVRAHTRHGDTLGNCPGAAASEPRTTTHGKPPWAHGPKKGERGQSPEHSRGHNNRHAEEQGPGGSSTQKKNTGKEH
jgi:hypothetical protein